MRTCFKTTCRGGFSLVDLVCALAAAALLVLLVVPLSAQMRGDDRALTTQNHLRAYAAAHAAYVHDHGYLPPFGGLGDEDGPDSECHYALVNEVGIFDSPVAPVSPGMMAMVNGFNDTYVADPTIYTSPADGHFRFLGPGDDCDDGRFGHFLLPSEDPRGVGATFSRIYFNPDSSGRLPRGFVGRYKLMRIEVGGLEEYREVWLQSAEHVISPADHVDLVEEDERSLLNNSIFVVPEGSLPDPNNEATRITRRHPNDSGHVAYFDAHVEALERMTERYWELPNDEDGRRMALFWPVY